MLKKIKSNFILKKLYDYVNTKRKLQSIVYNKKIQKKLGLNLIDFRRQSGRYLEKENDEIIEYNSYNHQKLFVGHYSNEKEMEKEKNIMKMEPLYLKENI